MKKTVLIILICSIGFVAHAQENRGLDNRFYFRFGYSQPSNAYMGWSEFPLTNVASFKRVGGVFEIGSIFIINNLDLGDGLRLGINVDYIELAYHHFLEEDFEEYWVPIGQLSSKVGPSISYNPVSKLVLDAFIKAKIPWVGGAYIYAEDIPELDDRSFIGSVGFGYSTGLNIRFGILIVGFDYSNSKIKLEDRENSDVYLGNLFDPSDDSEKTKTSYFNFTLGLNF